MSTASRFISALQQEQRRGNVSAETEQHLKQEFRTLGWAASDTVLMVAVEAEINRLDRQAATIRRLRDALLSVA